MDAEEIELLRPFCLGTQEKYLDAVLKHGGQTQAAKALNVHLRTVTRAIGQIRKRAAMAGVAPKVGVNHPVPDGYKMQGVSTLYDAKGKVKLQWVKANQDRVRAAQIIAEEIEALAKSVPAVPKINAPGVLQESKLLTLYTISDLHIGMYA